MCRTGDRHRAVLVTVSARVGDRLRAGSHGRRQLGRRALTDLANLASSYLAAGRTSEAITILKQAVTDSERLLGGDHPDTLTARANLAGLRQRG